MVPLKWTFSRALLLVVLMANSSLFAAELFRKQTGTATIATTTNSVTVTIPAVCMTQSFLVFSVSTDSNNPGDLQVGGQITNATTLTFTRLGNTSTPVATIKWQVFEFEGNVSVQRGITIVATPSVDIAITAVNLTKTFVIASMSNNGATVGDNDGFTAELTSTTNLRLSATAGNTPDFKVYWQVIEYQDAVVKKFSATLAAATASTTTTISPAISTLSKAFVISNHTIGANVNANDLPRTELTNTTTVTYTRGSGTAAALNFVTYVVEFTDLTTVVRGTQAFASGSVLQNVAVTAAASTGLFGPGTQGRQGSTNYATDDNLGHVWFNYELTSLTNLQITRAVGTGSTANAPYQLVTFEDQNTSPRTYYSLATGAWESNTSWSLSSDGSTGAVGVGVYPRRSDNVVIRTGHNITINSVTDNGLCGLSPDNLSRTNVGLFSKSGNIMFYQTGDILIRGTLTVTGIEMMVEGFTKIVSGGTFTLASDLVNLGFLEADAGSTFSTFDDITLAGNSTTIINTNSISSDDLNISFPNATLCGTGTTTLTNGLGSTITYFNGATVAQICNTFTVACSGVGCSGFPVVGTTNLISGNVGPGGIGNSTETALWLMANSGTSTTTNGTAVSLWSDQSGNANNASQAVATQQPLYQSSVINSQPTLLFDNAVSPNNDELVVPDNANLDNTNGLTILTVSRPLNLDGAARTIVSKRVGVASQQSYSFFFLTTNNLFADIDTNNNRFATSSTFSNSTNYINNLFYNGTLAAASRARIYVNGTLDVTATETSTTIPNYASNVTIGSINEGDGRPFGGHIAEVVIYRETLNEAQRTIADNYLSAKYAITVSNDVYTMDNAGNGNYDFEVAGIGQASDGSKHIDAKGTGAVRMWNPNGLANSEFLMWGHDNGALSGTTSGVDGTVIAERLVRIWRAGESADVGTVSISFDLSSLASPLGSNLRLLIDRNGNGFADNDVTPIVGSFINSTVVFSGIDFQSGDRFTLGNTNASIPLPVELISFNAKAQDKSVLLNWSTATEINNKDFTIERSSDIKDWSSIGTVSGAGNSTVRIDYSFTDEKAKQGTSYYRLKQTDFDGKYKYSSVVSVDLEKARELSAYPNPSNGSFAITSDFEIELEQVRFINMLGSVVPVSVTKKETETIVDPGDISAGIYFIQVVSAQGIKSIRVVRK
jgi:hypothetical protein